MTKRIWAAHAISPSRFSVSIGELNDENPFSRVVVYEEHGPVVWGHVDLPRTITSISDIPVKKLDLAAHMALSNEGDVYQLYGDIPFEHIDGAGVNGADAARFGSTIVIRRFGDTIYVAGHGSQVYRQVRNGDWETIANKEIDDLGENYFADVSLSDDKRCVAVVGSGRLAGPTEDEQRELERLRRERLREPYNILRKTIAKRTRRLGCAFVFHDKKWTRAATVESGHLETVLALPGGDFLAGGTNGNLLRFGATSDAEDVSIPEVKEDVNSLARFDGSILALLDTTILRLDTDFHEEGQIELPSGLGSPLGLSAIGDTIWYFDYNGVARYRCNEWQVITIPEDKFI